MNKRGFVSVVAIGIFAVIAVFLVLIQKITFSTKETLLSNRDEIKAELMSDAIFEYLQLQIQDHNFGYNSGEFKCAFNVPGAACNIGDENFSAMLEELAGDNEVEIKFKVEGRNEDKLNTNFAEAPADGLYSVPAPGTGSAGENCNNYTPNLIGDEIVRPNIDNSLVQMPNVSIDQLDYSCNWNKLVLGSDSTDRVMIPLYYEGANGEIVQPFFGANGLNETFILRLRTPCDCEDGEQGCSPIDSTVCTEEARFELPNDNEIVAQWQISSNDCELGEECEVLSGTDETIISNVNLNSLINYLFLQNIRLTFVRSSVSVDNVPFDRAFTFINNSHLLLYLTESIWSEDNQLIPQIEYQVLTSTPVTQNKIHFLSQISINGNYFENNNSIFLDAEDIDFALQN